MILGETRKHEDEEVTGARSLISDLELFILCAATIRVLGSSPQSNGFGVPVVIHLVDER